jgi:hypothetical protein
MCTILFVVPRRYATAGRCLRTPSCVQVGITAADERWHYKAKFTRFDNNERPNPLEEEALSISNKVRQALAPTLTLAYGRVASALLNGTVHRAHPAP